MTCLLVTNDFPPIISGISTQLYEAWRRLPHDRIAVLAPNTGGDKAFDAALPFPVFREHIPLGPGRAHKLHKMILDAWLTARLQRRYRFSTIHCGQLVSTGLAGLLCSKLYGVPFAVYVYGSETVRMGRLAPLRWLMHKVCNAATHIIANSECTRQEFIRFGVAPQKLITITPGVDTGRFRPQPPTDDLVRRFKPQGTRILLTVGRLDERKGHDTVIRAMPQISGRFHHNVRYIIVGTGREEARLRRLTAQLDLNGRVIFAGRVPDEQLPLYYNLCDVFVLPNRVTAASDLKGDYEGFGIVFLEAAACAKPVVAGRSGGAAEAVQDGDSGLLIDPLSPDELAHAVNRILADPDLATRLGTRGRQRTVDHFDWQLVAKRLEPLLGPPDARPAESQHEN